MRKNVLLFAIALILSGNVIAQRGGPSNSEKHMTRLKAELALSDAQVERLKKANDNLRQEYTRLRSDTSLTREAKMQKHKALAETRKGAMKDVLTKEQYEKWLSMRVPQGRRPSDGSRQTSGEWLKKEVGLSEEQAGKITSINSEMARRFKELRADTTMNRDDRMKAGRKIMSDRNDQIKNLLTAEQYERFQQAHRERFQQANREKFKKGRKK